MIRDEQYDKNENVVKIYYKYNLLHPITFCESKYIHQETLHNPELQNHSIPGNSRI